MIADNLFTTAAEARNWVLVNRNDGCICPCCGQIAKVYKRKINGVMARLLIQLYNLNINNDEFHHVSKILGVVSVTGTADFAKLKHWGFIEEKEKGDEEEDKKRRTSGYWRITDAGKSFAENKTTGYEYIYIYDAEVLGYSTTSVTILDALGTRFDYSELMRNI